MEMVYNSIPIDVRNCERVYEERRKRGRGIGKRKGGGEMRRRRTRKKRRKRRRRGDVKGGVVEGEGKEVGERDTRRRRRR